MTLPPSDLTSLVERVEGASGADRELDALLLPVFDPALQVRHNSVWRGKLCCGSLTDCLPPYSASVDAALALVERVLPGCGYDLTFVPGNDHPFDAYLWPDSGGPEIGEGVTPALAILSALLRALTPGAPT